jgi:hypothetical protein
MKVNDMKRKREFWLRCRKCDEVMEHGIYGVTDGCINLVVQCLECDNTFIYEYCRDAKTAQKEPNKKGE